MVLVDPRRVEDDGNALVLLQQAGRPGAGLVGGVVGRFVSVEPGDGGARSDGELAGEEVEAEDLYGYAWAGGNDGSLRRLVDRQVRMLERVLHAAEDEQDYEDDGGKEESVDREHGKVVVRGYTRSTARLRRALASRAISSGAGLAARPVATCTPSLMTSRSFPFRMAILRD